MNKKGFTLIELIISIVIAAIIIIVVANGYRQIVEAVARSSDLAKAVNLSEREFSMINSISYSDATLANGYNNLSSNYQSSGYDLRRQVSYDAGTDATTQSLKRITVTIYRSGSATPILTVVTLRTKNVTYAP